MLDENKSKEFREKLIILYLLSEVGTPLSMGEIEDILLPLDILELLAITGNMTNLIDSEMLEEIEKDNKIMYSLSESGVESISALEFKLNDYHREKLDRAISIFKQEKKNKSFVKAEYTKIAKNQSIVECQINEAGMPLIKMELRVPTNEQANKICDAWNSRGVDIFQEILKLFER